MYKGQLEGFPKEIVERMLECQVEQGNSRDVSIFEENRDRDKLRGGLTGRILQKDMIFGIRF